MAGNKLTHAEVDQRGEKSQELKYKANTPILQKEWVSYCKKEYGDKSKQQYIK